MLSEIKVSGRTIKIPKVMELFPHELATDLYLMLKHPMPAKDEPIRAALMVCYYLQYLRDGKYDNEKAMKMLGQFMPEQAPEIKEIFDRLQNFIITTLFNKFKSN